MLFFPSFQATLSITKPNTQSRDMSGLRYLPFLDLCKNAKKKQKKKQKQTNKMIHKLIDIANK